MNPIHFDNYFLWVHVNTFIFRNINIGIIVVCRTIEIDSNKYT